MAGTSPLAETVPQGPLPDPMLARCGQHPKNHKPLDTLLHPGPGAHSDIWARTVTPPVNARPTARGGIRAIDRRQGDASHQEVAIEKVAIKKKWPSQVAIRESGHQRKWPSEKVSGRQFMTDNHRRYPETCRAPGRWWVGEKPAGRGPPEDTVIVAGVNDRARQHDPR